MFWNLHQTKIHRTKTTETDAPTVMPIMPLDNGGCEAVEGDEEGKSAVVAMPLVQLTWHPLDTRQLSKVDGLEHGLLVIR